MFNSTELNNIRRTLEYDKQDLRRFENDPHTPIESIATVKGIIKAKEAKLAFFSDLPVFPSLPLARS
jgi:hypothetical protein